MKTLQIIGIVLGVILGIIFIYYTVVILLFSWVSSPSTNGAVAINKNISNQYYYKENRIVYVSNANFFSLGAKEIEQADSESFEVLAYNLAKDKNHVYHDEIILKDADPKTFEMILHEESDEKYQSYYYTKDAKQVFYFHDPLKEANPTTFQYLWGDFSKDDKTLFYNKNKMLSIDEKPLPIKNDTEGNYLRIGNVIYFKEHRIEKVHPETFEVIKGAFATDIYAIYSENNILKHVDPASFKILNKDYQADKNHLYYKAKILPNSDPDSYELINTLFSKDKNHLYYIGSIVMNPNAADYNSKKINQLENDFNQTTLIYDDNHTIFVLKKELKEISQSHTVFKDEVYCFHRRIIDADYKSFEVYENCEDRYARDKNQVFYLSIVIKDADIKSFKIINSSFAKDNNYVYFFEKRLLDVDPDTFVYQEGMYGEAIDQYTYRLAYDPIE
ncbi:DKNYY domain-containing protein [uncultured Aquimarina sp.]|uniref:DKNYY domain-containing protein n=1 Tax=uncultured Aquimarina sp. TaxID=575652 RepID=UPI00260C2298|nr:DKNYY domain-containing protein [uncultured Aquimarina sp.]